MAFEPVGWDQAFEEIVERLQRLKSRHGPEAVGIYTGRGSFDMALCDLFQPADAAVSSASSVLFPFGSPNTLGVGALCYVSFAMIAPHVTMGEMYVTMDADIDQAELVVIWGANPATDSPPLAHRQILKARQRGAEVVAIDPRRNETARDTEAEWVPIRPGTDGALALSMIHVLVEEELYDESFAADWCVGFDELCQLTQHHSPEVTESTTGVPAEKIRDLARKLAAARGACPVMYTGLEYSDSGVQAVRAVLTLWALAGQLDVPGGLVIRMRENQFPQNRRHLLRNPDVKKALGRDRFPVYSAYRGESHAIALPDAVLHGQPYRLRALIVLGGSIITAWPNPALWRETLASLELLVTINRYHTADSAYADLVLPAATGYEQTSYMRYGPLFKIRERLIDPVGEARSDIAILAELARRLGYGDLFPQSEEQLLEWALAGTRFTVEEVRRHGGVAQVPSVMMEYKKWQKGRLRSDGKPGFDTPSGKFEIASSILAEHGYDALPVYTEPAEGPVSCPDVAASFPLVFDSGTRTRANFRSQHHGVRGLVEQHPEPCVTLNSGDALARSIRDGDLVWVETPRGRLSFRARVTDDIVAGAVDADMGGGGPLGPEAWQRCNVNELTDLSRYDPISGFPIYKALLCEVSRAEAGTRESSSSARPALAVERAVRPSRAYRSVYLDHNATTPLDPEVFQAMRTFFEREWGNPSSIHGLGNRARSALEAARRQLAQLLNCTARRIVFTGGGSEASNLAIKGALSTVAGNRRRLLVSAIEHPSVVATARAMTRLGYDVRHVPVDRDGVVRPDRLSDLMSDDVALVSVMLANNETGAIQPISRLVEVAHAHGALLHSDAVQALGKIPVDVEELGVDLLTVSSHKVYGPKGVGALYARKTVELSPIIDGGGQERGLRAGTENVAGIVGFGKACELAQRRLGSAGCETIARLRNQLESGILQMLDGVRRNGPVDGRLPNTSNLTLPKIRGESLVLALDRRGVCFSSGSACKSGDPRPSPALLAMGLSDEQAHCAVRFSLGTTNTEDDIQYALAELEQLLKDGFAQVRFVACR